ncbi:MAG: tetratricopeptide repeat protein [Mariprofundaceae bacterium]
MTGMRIFSAAFAIFFLIAPIPVSAAQNKDIANIRSLLHNGKPVVAEKKAHALLKTGKIDDRERRNLLRIIAIAEEMQTKLHEYSDADRAIAAWKALLHEFISPDDAANIRGKIAWLYWKQDNLDAAIRTAEEILKESAGSREAMEGRMLLARIHIKQGKLRLARKHLLSYMLDTSTDSDQARGLAWVSVVDFREHRQAVAFENIGKAIRLSPGLVSANVTLFSTYIQLLYTRNDTNRFTKQSERFLKLYIDRPEALLIRLMRADMQAKKGMPAKAAGAYERLSEVAPGTSIGIRAFMRKMMIQHAQDTGLDSLKPVLSSLKKISSENQLSPIEDESMFDQALLWSRLAGQVEQAEQKALDLYSQVLVGTTPIFISNAKIEGRKLFTSYLQSVLSKKNTALESIVLWRRYPQFRGMSVELKGAPRKAHHRMQLGVARAMRQLMDFDAAEKLLAQLYSVTQDNVEGDRVMLERAKLWLDRNDRHGYAKIMRWLENHSFTLYRPEMLLIAASIQLASAQPNEASQTLKQVAVADIAPDMHPDYWQSKAKIAVMLEQWHRAASAWKQYIALFDKPPASALRAHADVLFNAGEYAEAEIAYLKFPEENRDARWQYQLAVAERYTGKWRSAEARLKALMEKDDAGEYVLRARLMLADQQADALMEKM